LTLLLLPPLDLSLARARRRNDRHVKQHGTDENRFEREGDEFYRRVYDQYRAIAEREPQRVVLLNEPGTIEQIGERIASVVRERMGAMARVETAKA
jgi:dTMP kinase